MLCRILSSTNHFYLDCRQQELTIVENESTFFNLEQYFRSLSLESSRMSQYFNPSNSIDESEKSATNSMSHVEQRFNNSVHLGTHEARAHKQHHDNWLHQRYSGKGFTDVCVEIVSLSASNMPTFALSTLEYLTYNLSMYLISFCSP